MGDITISHHQLPATMGNRPPHAYQHYPTPKGSKGGCPCGCNRWCNRCSSKWGWRCQHGNKGSCFGGGGAGPPFTKIVKAETTTKKTVASVTTKTSTLSGMSGKRLQPCPRSTTVPLCSRLPRNEQPVCVKYPPYLTTHNKRHQRPLTGRTLGRCGVGYLS